MQYHVTWMRDELIIKPHADGFLARRACLVTADDVAGVVALWPF